MSRIKLQFVQAFVDRHGRARHYFRRRGRKQIPLPGLPGSDEFMAAYQAAVAAMPKPMEIGAGNTKPGTINALVVAYYGTAGWTSLDPDTQKTRKRIIEKFRAQHGGKRVALLMGDHIEIMMAGIPNVHARRMIRPRRSLCRSRPRARATTPGLIPRSNNIAPIGRWGRNSGS
jgi:hypothetical protein